VLAKAPPTEGDPTSLALSTDLSNAKPLPPEGEAGPGSLFISEAHDSRWRATQAGRRLTNTPAFGWANGYPLDGGAVEVKFASGPQRALALVVQAAAWLALAVFLIGGRWRRRGRGSDRAPSVAAVREIDLVERVGATSPAPVSEVLQ
jgi:hypothetical protein